MKPCTGCCSPPLVSLGVSPRRFIPAPVLTPKESTSIIYKPRFGISSNPDQQQPELIQDEFGYKIYSVSYSHSDPCLYFRLTEQTVTEGRNSSGTTDLTDGEGNIVATTTSIYTFSSTYKLTSTINIETGEISYYEESEIDGYFYVKNQSFPSGLFNETTVEWGGSFSGNPSTRDSALGFTVTIASPAVVTMTAHGLENGMAVTFSTTGALPTGLTAGTVYYVINKTDDTFQVSATRGGAAINTSGSQSGTHTLKRWWAAATYTESENGSVVSSITRPIPYSTSAGEQSNNLNLPAGATPDDPNVLSYVSVTEYDELLPDPEVEKIEISSPAQATTALGYLSADSSNINIDFRSLKFEIKMSPPPPLCYLKVWITLRIIKEVTDCYGSFIDYSDEYLDIDPFVFNVLGNPCINDSSKSIEADENAFRETIEIAPVFNKKWHNFAPTEEFVYEFPVESGERIEVEPRIKKYSLVPDYEPESPSLGFPFVRNTTLRTRLDGYFVNGIEPTLRTSPIAYGQLTD